MDQDDLFALLVLLIERSGGSVELHMDDVLNLDMEDKALTIVPSHDNSTVTIQIENQEDIDATYVESKAID